MGEHMNKLDRLLIILVIAVAAVGTACMTSRRCVYRFDDPSGAQPARARLSEIETALSSCRSSDCPESCAKYELEAGLTWEKILEQDLEAVQHYRAAMRQVGDNCDARLLLASVLSKMTRDPASVSEAARLVAGETEGCGSGTVATFFRARSRIFSAEAGEIAQGRRELERLASVNLGESGVTQEDVHNVLLYTYLAEADFAAAARRMGESPEVSLQPKLAALMYIGLGRSTELGEIGLDGRAEVRTFLLEALDGYRPEPEIERVVSDAADRFGAVEAIPWDRLEAEWVDETPWQTGVQKVIVEDEYERFKAALETRSQTIAGIRTELARLQEAEIDLLRKEIESALGSEAGAGNAVDSYRLSYERLAGKLEDLADSVRDITRLDYLPFFISDAQALLEEARVVNEFSKVPDSLESEDVVIEVLQGYAIAKSTALKPEEFFRPFTIRLDQIESVDVANNVRRTAAREGKDL